MAHITKTRMTQICKRVRSGETPAEVAQLYGIPTARVLALAGITADDKAVEIAAADVATQEPSAAAEDWEE